MPLSPPALELKVYTRVTMSSKLNLILTRFGQPRGGAWQPLPVCALEGSSQPLPAPLKALLSE